MTKNVILLEQDDRDDLKAAADVLVELGCFLEENPDEDFTRGVSDVVFLAGRVAGISGRMAYVEEKKEKKYTPKSLAKEIGCDQKTLRKYLRKTVKRPSKAKGTRWVITEEIANAAREHFAKVEPVTQ